jgi:1,2-diacylglycerol 3-beta-galactosyltransferase
VLFATIAAGGGHVATAKAMAEALEHHYPGEFSTRIADYMREVGATRFDERHKAAWRWALRYPLSARLGQRLIDAVPQLAMRVQRQLLAPFARLATEALAREAPALVVSNHGLITTGLALAQRRYGLRVPVLTFATEPHLISAYWADPWAERILVPSEETRRRLIAMGVSAEKLEVVGYPVGRAFLDAPDKAEARRALGLENAFTCLVSMGGEGIGGNATALLEGLLERTQARYVVICGRNAQLASRLSARFAGEARVRIEGFTECMASYLAASDVVVGKAGPASVYEALAVGRPVLVTSYAGRNEWGVVRFLREKQLGELTPSARVAAAAIARYRQHPDLLDDVAARCRALDLAGASERLAHAIARYARAHA